MKCGTTLRTIDAKRKDTEMFNAAKTTVFLATFLAANTLTFGLTIFDDFTQGAINDSPGATNSNGMDWVAIGPACLTAGNSSNNSTGVANTASNYSNIPACNITANSGIGNPDPVGGGALRLTNAVQSQAGAIVSRGTFPSNQGIQVIFTTYTYAGSGADGIGFFLQDGAVPTTLPYVGTNGNNGNYNIGVAGAGLGYTCSNIDSTHFNGLTGGYIGLGIDEFGNFTSPGLGTATGPRSIPNTISLRGAGNVSWYWLNSRYPSLYPTSAPSSSQSAMIRGTCSTGLVQAGVGPNIWFYGQVPIPLSYTTSALSWSAGILTVTVGGDSNIAFLVGDTINIATNGGNPPMVNGRSIVGSYVVTAVSGKTFSFKYPGGSTSYANQANGKITVNVMDYASIPESIKTLPGNTPLWTPVGTRSAATPITYKLSISPTGSLNFLYSYNGGAYQQVLTNQQITNSNGPIPEKFRFGFMASTGAYTAIHEIACFAVQPTESSSSAGANTIQAGEVRTGTQIYLASYNPNNWSGSLVSDAIVNTNGVISVSMASQWDGNCVLTGGGCASMGTVGGVPVKTITVQAPDSRSILTWNGTSGTPFRWANLTSAQQAVLNSTDSAGTKRLDWLRGVRTQEQANGGGLRTRIGVLGDIVNSSPTWIGPPTKNYTATFTDALTGAVGAETDYTVFKNRLATRLNVVYSGSNDGMLHGFRSGSNNVDGTYNPTNNDGYEVLAYMPSTVLSNSNVVGVSNPAYSHSYFVDEAPGSGDLYYKGAWHTWLVGGLGPGGAGIYALDVTDPTGITSSSIAFSENNAARLVIGDWTPASLTAATCVNALAGCGNNLGNTYGTPLIRRLHNGQWGIIFGNGFGSANGRAGVYIGLVNPGTGALSFYWLDTGNGDAASNANGIAYVSSADLDGDFIIDYLYAGDLRGNVWRFDLTSSNPANWAASKFGRPSATPLFVARDNSGNLQPITSSIAVTATLTENTQRLILGFGTGRATPFTISSATTYQGGTQTVYGIWDWDMTAWNSLSSTPYVALPQVTISPYLSFTRADLFTDTVASQTATTRTATTAVVCWKGNSACKSGNAQYGWKFDLPDSGEQVIYNPVFSGGLLLLNTTTPPGNSASKCTQMLPSGWTMGFDMTSGGGMPQNIFPASNGSFIPSSGAAISGLKQGAVGTPYIVTVGNKQYAISSNASGGAPSVNQLNTQGGVTVKRISWEQLR
jgi:type IV pilus assembly protein PilY1